MQGGIDTLCSQLPSRRRCRVSGPDCVTMPADGLDVMFALAFAAVRSSGQLSPSTLASAVLISKVLSL